MSLSVVYRRVPWPAILQLDGPLNRATHLQRLRLSLWHKLRADWPDYAAKLATPASQRTSEDSVVLAEFAASWDWEYCLLDERYIRTIRVFEKRC